MRQVKELISSVPVLLGTSGAGSGGSKIWRGKLNEQLNATGTAETELYRWNTDSNAWELTGKEIECRNFWASGTVASGKTVAGAKISGVYFAMWDKC